MNSSKLTSAQSSTPERSPAATPASSAAAPRAQRFGNHHLQRLLQSRVLQAKLTVSDPGDAFEQEADRVADQVMRMPAHDDVSTTTAPVAVRRKCATCEDELQRSEVANDHPAPTVDGATEQAINSLSGGGHALPESVRSFMEPRFNADFSGVRIHTDAHAQRLARSVDAQAFTVGRNVVFGAGRYAPESEAGRRLLAHELTHVVQQNGATPSLQRAPEDANRWRRSESAARYRGQVMARRIRNHGIVSKDAEAKIEQELAYFEGAAREVYIREVRPTYLGTGEVHFPADPLPRLGTDDAFTRAPIPYAADDTTIYAGIEEMKRREEAELETARQAMIARLEKKTEDWQADDREFALALLRPFLRHTTNIDARAVSDHIRKPILERYEAWLHAQDEYRLKHLCVKLEGFIGTLADANMKLNPGFDNCVSWFATDHSYGPSELMSLERRLRLNRFHGYGKAVENVADYIYWDVHEFRKLTDPLLLQQKAIAGGIVNKAVAYGMAVSTPGPRPALPRAAPALPPEPVALPSAAPPAAAVRGGAPLRIQAPTAPAPGAPVTSATRVTSEPPQPSRVTVPSVGSKGFVRGFAREGASAPRTSVAGANEASTENTHGVPTASPTETTQPMPQEMETVVGGFTREPSRRPVQPKEAVIVGGPGREPGRTSEPAKDPVVVGGPGRQPGRTSEPARDPVRVGGLGRDASRPTDVPETLPPGEAVPVSIGGPDDANEPQTNPLRRPATTPGEAVPEHVDDVPTGRVATPTPIARTRAQVQVVGEYRITSTKEMGADGVFHRHIHTLEHIGGKTTSTVAFNRFFRALIEDARAAGARVLIMTGEFPGNDNVGRLDRYLKQFGGNANVDGKSIEIVIPLAVR